jgi:hypothetical protein
MHAMCPMRPIPPVFPMLFDLAEVVEHLVEDATVADSDAETIPWTFNPDAAEFVPQGNIFGQPRGTTRVWADMTDSDGEQEAEQETAAQRNARYAAAASLENLRHSSLQVIYVLDPEAMDDMPMLTDGNTLVGEVHARTAQHFGLNPDSFVLAYAGDFLVNSMDITNITQEETAVGVSISFNIVRRPKFVHIEFRTVEHGNIRLSVQLTDIVDTLYTRISFLTGWGRGFFTIRHENHVLDNMMSDMRELGITADTHMVMVGSLVGGTQRFHIGSPCAAAASRLDESDISDMDLESTSSTSMPDMTRLVVAIPMTSSKNQPPPSFYTCPPVRVGPCPPHLPSSSAAASGSAGLGSSAAAPPWCPSSPPMAGVSTLSVQGLKRTYAGAVDAAPGRAYQRSTARVSSLKNPL